MSDQETELKFKLGPQDLERVRAHPLMTGDHDGGGAGPVGEQLVSTYYDTPDHALRTAGVSLRVREIDGGRRVQTVKSLAGAGLFRRGEWEQDLDGEAGFDLDAALRTPLGEVLDEAGCSTLAPVFISRITRSSRRVQQGDAEIEVSLDEGEIEAGERRAPVNELELELKAGAPDALFDLARTLGQAGALQLSFVTKAEAGYALLDPEPKRVFKSSPADVRPGQTAAEAFQSVARACLSQLSRNEPAVLETRSREALHQMRVSIRRLRTAFTLFREVIADDRRAALAGELKWAVGELNDARNLDVFIHDTFEPAAERERADRSGMGALGDALRAAQQTAYARAHSAIASDRYRRLMLDLTAWIEAGPWVVDQGGVNTGARSQDVTAFAAQALSARFRAVRKKSGALHGDDPAARHRLRIALKKLRYAAEFVSPLYGHGKTGRHRDRFIGLVSDLQDDLGVLNDLATARETVFGALVSRAEHAPPAEAAFDAGLIVARRAVSEQRLVRQAAKAFARLEQAKPFW